jgi:hypothetical protein
VLTAACNKALDSKEVDAGMLAIRMNRRRAPSVWSIIFI